MKLRALLICLFCSSLFAVDGGVAPLVNEVSEKISTFLSARYQAGAAITAFENHSELSDLAAQKFYQVLVSRLETRKEFRFSDRMVAFSHGHGRFDQSRIEELDFLIALKMIRSGPRVGVGITIFSRELHRMIAIDYAETLLSQGAVRFLEMGERAFALNGFESVTRMEVSDDLLDVATLAEAEGEDRYYFMKKDSVDIFAFRSRRLVRLLTLKIDWGRPKYPARKVEGKLLVFRNENGTWLSAAINTSPRSRLFCREQGKWREEPGFNFAPLKMLRINDRDFIAGARFATGRNHFRGGLLLMPMNQGKADPDNVYEKPLPESHVIDFTAKDNRLAALHLIDRSYRYRVYTTDFENSVEDERLRGSALAALRDQWVAVSDYTRGKDRIFFFNVADGARRQVYEASFPNMEIRFIRDGSWEKAPGFWVCLEKIGGTQHLQAELQFWRPGRQVKATEEPSDDVRAMNPGNKEKAHAEE